MATKAQIKASNKYDKENTKSVLLKLNKKTDADIIEMLDAVPSKMGYIKDLIRQDIEVQKKTGK
jgi:multidrug efflux pump subunit AcrB